MNLLETKIESRIGYITLNRPEKRNALSPELVTELRQAFSEMGTDETVKVVVLKANGKVFCAGADLEYLQQISKNTYEQNLTDTNNLKDLLKLIYELDKPVIAQVHGHAIAGGAGLAGVCDFIFAAPEAKFGYTEVKIGFVPAIVSVFLVARIGEGRAREMLLSGHLHDARYMAKIGAITEVIEAEFFEQHVKDFALRLANENSGTSMKLTKHLINQLNRPLDEALDVAAEINTRSRTTEDFKKGISAFVEKREINW